jgi:hypothetical protein
MHVEAGAVEVGSAGKRACSCSSEGTTGSCCQRRANLLYSEARAESLTEGKPGNCRRAKFDKKRGRLKIQLACAL